MRQAWLLSKSQGEAVLRAEKLMGRPVGYSTMFRNAVKNEWPKRGSGPKPVPTKRRRRRKVRR